VATFRGIAFPFGKDNTSFPAAVEDAQLVKESLIQIVTTARGERIMRPDFGSAVYSFIFENNNVLLTELIRDELSAAIAKFEPRAILRNIVVERDKSEVIITINYIVSLTGQQDSVSIPLATNAG
jgi:phage baseplate assembly protein W